MFFSSWNPFQNSHFSILSNIENSLLFCQNKEKNEIFKSLPFLRLSEISLILEFCKFLRPPTVCRFFCCFFFQYPFSPCLISPTVISPFQFASLFVSLFPSLPQPPPPPRFRAFVIFSSLKVLLEAHVRDKREKENQRCFPSLLFTFFLYFCEL